MQGPVLDERRQVLTAGALGGGHSRGCPDGWLAPRLACRVSKQVGRREVAPPKKPARQGGHGAQESYSGLWNISQSDPGQLRRLYEFGYCLGPWPSASPTCQASASQRRSQELWNREPLSGLGTKARRPRAWGELPLVLIVHLPPESSRSPYYPNPSSSLFSLPCPDP